MFYNSKNLTRIEGIDVSKISPNTTEYQDMFLECDALEYVKINSTDSRRLILVLETLPSFEGLNLSRVCDISGCSDDVKNAVKSDINDEILLIPSCWTIKYK